MLYRFYWLLFLFVFLLSSDPSFSQPSIQSETTSISGEITDETAVLERTKVRCIRVFSGARIEVEGPHGGTMKIYYLGVQLPDAEDPDPQRRALNKKAFALNREWVENKTLMLEFESTEPDAAGRLGAYVFVDQVFVNAELIRQGCATVAESSPEIQLQGFLLKQQNKAKEEKLGLWGIPSAIPKSGEKQPQGASEKRGNYSLYQTTAERNSVRSQSSSLLKSDYYVGTIKSDIFHHPHCDAAKKIAEANRVNYSSREEARKAGRRPCKLCNP